MGLLERLGIKPAQPKQGQAVETPQQQATEALETRGSVNIDLAKAATVEIPSTDFGLSPATIAWYITNCNSDNIAEWEKTALTVHMLAFATNESGFPESLLDRVLAEESRAACASDEVWDAYIAECKAGKKVTPEDLIQTARTHGASDNQVALMMEKMRKRRSTSRRSICF